MKWEIEKLRGVGRVEIELDDSKRVFVLFGQNGVGKTKILEALLIKLTLHVHPQPSGLLWRHSRAGIFKNENGGTTYSLVKGEELRLLDTFIGTDQLKERPFAFLGASFRSSYVTLKPSDSMLKPFVQRKQEFYQNIDLKFNKEYLSSLGMDGSLNDWFCLRARSANLFEIGADNRSNEIFAILRILNQLDGDFDPVFFQITPENKVFIKVKESPLEIGELSSGYTALLKMVQSIVAQLGDQVEEQTSGLTSVIIIDEIESHLHPEWQAHIVPNLKTLFPGAIFVIATHSPLVLSQLEDGEAYLLKRDEDDVVRSQVILSPSNRLLIDVIDDAFNIDLNQLKSDSMVAGSQNDAKKKLREFLNEQGLQHGE